MALDDSRKHDTKVIEKGLKDKDPLVRQVAKNAADNIRKQSDRWTKDARERLIKETRLGNKENAKQVRDDIVKHRGGRQMKGNRGTAISVSFNWSDEQWEQVYGRRNIQDS